MLHGVLPEEILKYSSSSFLVPGWSLSLEWQFYLLAPFIVFSLRRNPITGVLTCLGALALMYGVENYSGFTWMKPSFLPIAMQYFLIGIASRFIMERRESGRQAYFWIFTLAVSAIFSDWLALVIWAITLCAIAHEAGKLKLPKGVKLLNDVIFGDSFVRTLGQWSYSSYLTHILLFSVVVGGFSMLVGGDIFHTTAVVLVVLAVLLTLPISWVTYTFIERPFSRIGSKVARTLTPANAETAGEMQGSPKTS